MYNRYMQQVQDVDDYIEVGRPPRPDSQEEPPRDPGRRPPPGPIPDRPPQMRTATARPRGRSLRILLRLRRPLRRSRQF